MNIARVGLLVVAVGAAGAAAFLVRGLTHRPAHENAAQIAPKLPPTEVLVAAHAIEPGTIVKPDDVRWQDWPADGVSPTFKTEQSQPKALQDAIGATARAHIDIGEPITDAKLVKGANAGFMAAMLTPGMRAVSTKIDEDTAAGGFILPGDHVDVVLTRRIDRSAEGGPSDDFESRTVLSDVRVLAIGQTYAQTGSDKVVQGRTATLELSPSEAETLTLSAAMGTINLTLRSAASGDITAAIGPRDRAMRHNDGGAIRVIRYSHVARVTPAAPSEPGVSQ
jgi:pilus assembly protein CpaB